MRQACSFMSVVDGLLGAALNSGRLLLLEIPALVASEGFSDHRVQRRRPCVVYPTFCLEAALS